MRGVRGHVHAEGGVRLRDTTLTSRLLGGSSSHASTTARAVPIQFLIAAPIPGRPREGPPRLRASSYRDFRRGQKVGRVSVRFVVPRRSRPSADHLAEPLRQSTAVRSSRYGATICRSTGGPSFVSPTGAATAGGSPASRSRSRRTGRRRASRAVHADLPAPASGPGCRAGSPARRWSRDRAARRTSGRSRAAPPADGARLPRAAKPVAVTRGARPGRSARTRRSQPDRASRRHATKPSKASPG